jgi:histidinol-phosphate aminotransferase
MLRLAANECPHGPFPGAREAAAGPLDALHRYPGPGDALVAALAERHGLAPEQIVLGNGADAIIGYLSAALLQPGDEVVTGWPSFPTYVTDARTRHARPVTVPLRADGAMDLEAMLAAITPATRIAWICSPNNPTGASVRRAELAAFLDALPGGVLAVIDEAYYEYAAGPEHVDAIAEHVTRGENVAVLRTFSKIYGLAGLRIGWLAGPAELAARLVAVRHFYDVIDVAIAAALASLADADELGRRRAQNAADRARLEAGLDALGLTRLPSDANFVCIVVPGAPAIAGRLRERGILVRTLDDLDRPDLMRITVGTPEEIDRLLAALPAALG